MSERNDLPDYDDLPVGICRNCGVASLRPVEDVFSEIERQVLTGRDTELWACPCGHTEERTPGAGEMTL